MRWNAGKYFSVCLRNPASNTLRTPALLSDGEVRTQGYASYSRQACCFAQYDELRPLFALAQDGSCDCPKYRSSGVAPDARVSPYVLNPGCAMQVQVTYNFKFILPFLPKGMYTMDSTSEMIISQ
jgi:hypothetical protein